jgi:mono/diheme cytochrome c family protein
MTRYRKVDHVTTLKASCVAGLMLAGITPSSADGDPERGEKIANEGCVRCHAVSEDNRFAGIGSTPSFMMMVNFLSDWEERFQTFYARRPHFVHIRVEGIAPLTALPSNAAIIEITLDDVDDLVAYARTLQDKDESEIPEEPED